MTIRRLAASLPPRWVGFSFMMEKDEEGTLRRIKALQREVIETKAARTSARV
jgi:adenylate cyclase